MVLFDVVFAIVVDVVVTVVIVGVAMVIVGVAMVTSVIVYDCFYFHTFSYTLFISS